ncbi:Protein hgh1 [Entomophthora muscae]|nr:Protein hgh1 [Entomophthora muscae]KAJ9088825.1 Protein hgh1 [Entomophthora muscae]
MEQLDELFDFFLDPKPEVRQLASDHLKSFTGVETLKQEAFKEYFTQRATRVVTQCVKLIHLDWHNFPIAAHNAISALTNLVVDATIAAQVPQHPEFLPLLVTIVSLPDSVLADPVSMLLSNLTKHEGPAVALLKTDTALEDLADVFVKGVDKMYNKQANYDFLASVFANLSMFPIARVYFLVPSSRDGLLPITRLMVFSEHKNIIRRGGVISAIKNCCFESKYHAELLKDGGSADLLPYILLPLCGPEAFDDDDMEGMPEDLQLLPEDKRRESDPKLRQMIVETLLILTNTRPGREAMRARKVYPVLRELHKVENSQPVLDAIDDVVQMLMRDEMSEPKEEASAKKPKTDDDMIIEEII